MWKPMLAGTVALALCGTSSVLAQQRPAPATPQAAPSTPAQAAPAQATAPKATPQKPDTAKDESSTPKDESSAAKEASSDNSAETERREQQAEDQAELEGRIASLKVRLMLTDDQAKNWAAFETALREFVASRMEQQRKFHDWKRSDNPLENMEARADFMVNRGTALKAFTTAAMPLYNSLDAKQQHQFRRAALRGVMMMMMRHGYRHDRDHSCWRDRGDDRGCHGMRRGERGDDYGGYGRRWGGRDGDDDDGSYHRRQGWHHRGDDMMGPRGGMMGDRWSGRDRDDYDDDRGSAGKQSYSDDDDGNGSSRSKKRALKPYEERF